MRISVVTPSFNMASYLEETIRSVIENLRDCDEYFVIDGGSTDGSVDIIRRYADRITGWVSEQDDGYADAIGKGFDRASGDALCWINAGDVYLSGAFDMARSMYPSDADMIFGDDFHIDEVSRVIAFSRGWAGDLCPAMLLGGWSPLQDACFWRRDLYERVGGIDRSLQYAADFDLFLRMALAGRVKYVPVTFSAFRRHAGQKSVQGAHLYHAERVSIQRREQQRQCQDAGSRLAIRRIIWRLKMSCRARLGPVIWRRADLAGQPVALLKSQSYWPRSANTN